MAAAVIAVLLVLPAARAEVVCVRVEKNGGVSCACTGDLLPCGVVTNEGACGGTCPGGLVCAQTEVLGPGGRPQSLTCGCVAP